MKMEKNVKTRCIKAGVLMTLCLFLSLGSTVYAAAPTVAFNNVKIRTGLEIGGTAYSTEALKTSAKDYATIKISSLSNTSYGVWMRMDKGTQNNRKVATSEQHITSVKTVNSYYKSGMKTIGATYVVVGRLAPGSPNVTVSGNATP